MKWGAVIAAGGEAEPDLASAMGTSRKALARFGETTSLARTLVAVKQASIENCVTVSGHDVRHEVTHGEFLPEGDSAIDNALLGLEALGTEVEAILFIPADTPLLDAQMILDFTGQVGSRASADRWYGAGLAPALSFAEMYPGTEVQPLRLREGKYLSGALYASNPTALRHALELLKQMRRNRKSQASMALRLGPINLLRYLAGRVSLADAERIVGRAFGGQTILVADCHPATCLDFDTVSDYHDIQRIVADLGSPSPR